jgi:hypothetical protein
VREQYFEWEHHEEEKVQHEHDVLEINRQRRRVAANMLNQDAMPVRLAAAERRRTVKFVKRDPSSSIELSDAGTGKGIQPITK